MPKDTPLSPACLECTTCSPGCSTVAIELPPGQRESMRRLRDELLGGPADLVPRQCWHCAQAPCLEACPAEAMRRDAGSGLVWVDRSRCVGCWMCVLACPLGAVIPSADGRSAVKCDGCRGRDIPACAGSCRPRDALSAPAHEIEAVVQRRAVYAAAGWGCPGPASYPEPQANPRSIAQPPPRANHLRYLIVGSGIAAVRAAEEIRASDPGCEITMVSEETTAPYSRVLLSHHLAGLRDERSLALRPADWRDELGLEFVAGDGAVALDAGRRRVVLRSGRELEYDRLLIATGAISARLAVPGAGREGVLGLRHLRDVQDISSLAPREVVVVGGGLIGVKAAEALQRLGTRVAMVEKMGQLLPRVLDGPASEMVRERLEANGVRVLTGVGVREIEGGGRARGVLLEGGERLACDLVVVAVGVEPNIAWLRGSPVQVRIGVLVDERMRTNLPGVWAAGDVVEGSDLLGAGTAVNALWPMAAAQGRVAGANMAGGCERFAGSLPMNTLDVFGLAAASFGQVSGAGSSVIDQRSGRYQKRVYRGGTLIGAVLVGELQEAGRLLAEARRFDHA